MNVHNKKPQTSRLRFFVNKTSFEWCSVDSSAIDIHIVAERTSQAKCANEVLRIRFIYQFQVFQNVELRDSIAAADNETSNFPRP